MIQKKVPNYYQRVGLPVALDTVEVGHLYIVRGGAPVHLSRSL